MSIPLNPHDRRHRRGPGGRSGELRNAGSHGGNMDHTASPRARRCTSPWRWRARCSAAATCPRRWAMARLACRAPRWPATLRSRSQRCPTCTWLIRLSRPARTSASSRPPSLSTQRPIAPCTRWWICCTTAPASTRPSWSWLLSLVADVQVCQMVDPQKTVRFMVPKYVLESLGFKRRRREGGRAVAFSPDPIGGHLGGCVVPETCGFAPQGRPFRQRVDRLRASPTAARTPCPAAARS